jgi:Cft2 family RNA processing exonuclease
VHFGDSIQVGDVQITYLPASHILGAAMVHLATPAGNVLFTGDYCVTAQQTVPALDRPSLSVDLIVTESTYGDRLHSDRKTAETRLVNRVSATLENDGRVLIPAFAIGRAQEILLILKNAVRNGRMPEVPIFVDGMIRPVCEAYARNPRYVSRALWREMRNARHPFYSKSIRPVTRSDERPAVLEAGRCVIVSSSVTRSSSPATRTRNHRDALSCDSPSNRDREKSGSATRRSR